VHLLYFGQSAGYFELKPGMDWPDGSWALSKLPGETATKTPAGIALIAAALIFAAGGVGILLNQAWWRQMLVAATTFSSLIFILLWDGRMHNLDGQGLIGILINLTLVVILFLLHWPSIE